VSWLLLLLLLLLLLHAPASPAHSARRPARSAGRSACCRHRDTHTCAAAVCVRSLFSSVADELELGAAGHIQPKRRKQ
jgi:hypothetical protein